MEGLGVTASPVLSLAIRKARSAWLDQTCRNHDVCAVIGRDIRARRLT